MSNIEIVKSALHAWSTGNEQEVRALCTPDFVFAGPVPEPLNVDGFIGFMHACVNAMPDWNFNATDFVENGDKVTQKLHITGTQTGELVLPGLPPIPPTGRKVALPEDTQTFTIRDGKISAVHVDPNPNGGIPALLAQLGVAQ